MPKLNLYRKHRSEYVAPKKPVLIDVGRARYLTIEGKGKPGQAGFHADIGALYAMTFTIKRSRKFAGRDYAVSKLEGLWRPLKKPKRGPPREWIWKLMIRVPEFITKRDLRAALVKLKDKPKAARADRVALETLDEGKCVQVLHVGPYEKEQETIARMHEFARERGLEFDGQHHEMYISDPRRVAPQKLKTILRYPVRRARRRR